MTPVLRARLGLSALTLTLCLSAQAEIEPDWKELPAPPAPAFSADRLLPIEMPRYLNVRFGVDPGTFAISADGIVRYVVVATSESGAVNAMYEGIRCATGEVKTYARFGANGQWIKASDTKWQGLNDNLRSKHALALARQGVCDSRSTTASSVAEIIKALKQQ